MRSPAVWVASGVGRCTARVEAATNKVASVSNTSLNAQVLELRGGPS